MKLELHGILVLDKPAGMTSRDAVNRAIGWFPRKTKIGHTGTLDPLATGVLVLCIGNATRLAEYVQALDKTYRSTVIFGARSDTDDADGEITPTLDVTPVAEEAIRDALKKFIGTIEQVPPAYSAIKVAGRRAHELARKGTEVDLVARPIRIDAIEILSYSWPELRLEIRCGKGTYIRSLARDLGEQLGCGAYVNELRRTSVGSFQAEQGIKLEADHQEAWKLLLPVAAAVAHLPTVTLEGEFLTKFRHGNGVPCADGLPEKSPIAVLDSEGVLTGIGMVDERRLLQPDKILMG
ncbi:MAG: tRNA pseudouridine(55) synthase TruB [Planctomycetes bacterium]|nr:tRNA pseudouridine(55) synthase TruB [Planctomycetota bacterium]